MGPSKDIYIQAVYVRTYMYVYIHTLYMYMYVRIGNIANYNWSQPRLPANVKVLLPRSLARCEISPSTYVTTHAWGRG